MRDEPQLRLLPAEVVEHQRKVLRAADALGQIAAVEVGAERDVLGPIRSAT